MKGWPWRMDEEDFCRRAWVMNMWGHTPHSHPSHASPPRGCDGCSPNYLALEMCSKSPSSQEWMSPFLQLPLCPSPTSLWPKQWEMLIKQQQKKGVSGYRISGGILDSIISFKKLGEDNMSVLVPCYFDLTQSSDPVALFWVEE